MEQETTNLLTELSFLTPLANQLRQELLKPLEINASTTALANSRLRVYEKHVRPFIAGCAPNVPPRTAKELLSVFYVKAIQAAITGKEESVVCFLRDYPSSDMASNVAELKPPLSVVAAVLEKVGLSTSVDYFFHPGLERPNRALFASWESV
jgi:hypothetical protein